MGQKEITFSFSQFKIIVSTHWPKFKLKGGVWNEQRGCPGAFWFAL